METFDYVCLQKLARYFVTNFRISVRSQSVAQYLWTILSIFVLGQMGGYYNPYASGFSAAHMAAAAAAAAAQQSGQVVFFHTNYNKYCPLIHYKLFLLLFNIYYT